MFKDTDQTVDDPPRSRWRFWLLFVGVPFLLLICAGVGWVVSKNSGLRRAIAEADRLDPRWRLDEIEADRATPPAGQNGYEKIAAVIRLRPPNWLAAQKDEVFNDLPPERQLNEPQIATAKEVLGPVGPALAEARSLIDTPHGRHPITYTPDWISTLLPTIQTTREATNLLRYDVYDRAQAGDADGAVRSCHAAFNAGCSIGDEPTLISQLVRIACQAVAVNLLERTLAQGEPSDAVLAALQARLEAGEAEPLLLYGLRGERGGSNQLFENWRNGSVPTGNMAGTLGVGGGFPAGLNALLSVPGILSSQHAGLLEYMTEVVEIAKKPPEEWSAAFAAQNQKINDLPMLARLIAPAVDKVAEAARRNHAILRCAIVMIAAERYRKTNGHWPATPDDLVKAGLLKAVPGDPYAAGQPIKFAKAADGLIVYTVGQDGIDNGGALDKNPTTAGKDYGFRLWDVAARRQPPLPPKAADADPNAPPGGPGTPAPPP